MQYLHDRNTKTTGNSKAELKTPSKQVKVIEQLMHKHAHTYTGSHTHTHTHKHTPPSSYSITPPPLVSPPPPPPPPFGIAIQTFIASGVGFPWRVWGVVEGKRVLARHNGAFLVRPHGQSSATLVVLTWITDQHGGPNGFLCSNLSLFWDFEWEIDNAFYSLQSNCM